MVNLEQVKLLEAKVAKVVDYLDRLTKENAVLQQQKTELQGKLEAYQKRIDELEILVTDFKEGQGQIEEGILAALDRLNQFEKAIDKSIKDIKPAAAKVAPAKAAQEPADTNGVPAAAPAAKKSLLKATENAAAGAVATKADEATATTTGAAAAQTDAAASVDGDQTCFEIPDTAEAANDVPDPLANAANIETAPAENRELDIF